MTNRRQDHRIQKGTGRAKCQYCKETITTEELEVVAPISSKFERHYHLYSSGQCEGWIWHNWKFVTSLLWKLSDIGGDDFNEDIRLLISLWEEGSL